MRGRFVWRAVMVGALMAGALAACGDDDDDDETTTGGSGGGSGENTLKVEMVDYGYKVSGELKAGLVTIDSENTGKEWHMAGFGKLKAGKTLEELTTALQGAFGGGGEGEGTETTAAGATLRAAGQETTSTTAGEEAQSGQEGGGGEEDPFAEFIEEELGAPGHIVQPGQGQKLTVDLEAGSYVMICFIPTEGEGVPHLAKGMVSGFEVAEGASAAEEPEADATITLGDSAEPAGVPTDLEGGEHTFKVTSEGEAGKDFAIGQLDEGKEFSAFDEYFEGEGGFENEGGPPKGYAEKAPGKVLASTFEIRPGQSIWVTVDIPKGETYFVGTTNVEDESEETVDKFVKVDVS